MKTVGGPAALLAACVLALAGCKSSPERKTAAENALIKAQVEQVCREVGSELETLKLPTTARKAEEAQRQSAQIFQTATGKLSELSTNTHLPAAYEAWVESFSGLEQYNRRAAEAISRDGMASDQAMEASRGWEAQAGKANALARQAGLDNCLVAPPKAG